MKSVIHMCSFPKSGRTWLRFFLANYLNDFHRLGVDIDFRTMFQVCPNDDDTPGKGLGASRYSDRQDVPLVISSHRTCGPAFAAAPMILLVRSVYDTLVSFSFHQSARHQTFAGSVSDFVLSPEGAPAWVAYMNSVADHVPTRTAPWCLLTYEAMHRDVRSETGRLLRDFAEPLHPGVQPASGFQRLARQWLYGGLSPRQRVCQGRAIAASTFAVMRTQEQRVGIPGVTADGNRTETLRVREGAVGGYQRHLSPGDVAAVAEYSRERLSAEARRFLEPLRLMP